VYQSHQVTVTAAKSCFVYPVHEWSGSIEVESCCIILHVRVSASRNVALTQTVQRDMLHCVKDCIQFSNEMPTWFMI